MRTVQSDHKLMNLLKVHEVGRIICETNLGTLRLKIRKGTQNYFFTLDSVELPKDLNKELFDLLYAPKVPQPIITNKSNTNGTMVSPVLISSDGKVGIGIQAEYKKTKPKGGRPIKTKKDPLDGKPNEMTNRMLSEDMERGMKYNKKGGRPKGSKNKTKVPK